MISPHPNPCKDWTSRTYGTGNQYYVLNLPRVININASRIPFHPACLPPVLPKRIRLYVLYPIPSHCSNDLMLGPVHPWRKSDVLAKSRDLPVTTISAADLPNPRPSGTLAVK